jgi:hypothetical protein
VDTPARPDDVWFTDANPEVLLNLVRPPGRVIAGRAVVGPPEMLYDRRHRLYGCACARMVWDLLPTDARSLVSISERFAYGRASRTDLQASGIRIFYGAVTPQQLALNAAGWASLAVVAPRFNPADGDEYQWNPDEAARCAARAVAARSAGRAPAGRRTTEKWQELWNRAYAEARARQAEFVCDVFPPPGHTPRLHPDWRTATVMTLARQMNETGEYSALPILADALQDAGCDDQVMLDRCRASLRRPGVAGSAIHCRGNWVVDLLLGRE